MRRRTAAAATAAFVLLLVAAAPAAAKWLTSSVPENVEARVWVDSAPRVVDGGWNVRWDLQVVCPRGKQITGRVLVAERDPASIPVLAGEDQGITAVRDLDGSLRCTGHRQTLRLTLPVQDTQVLDWRTGETTTFHEPIHPAPSRSTSAAVQLRSPESTSDGGFFAQYCAAPACAEVSGPYVTLR